VIAGAILAASLALAAGDDEPLRFEDLDGATLELARPVDDAALVIHYWATWCTSCVHELAALEATARACEGSGVRVLAVDVGEPPDVVRRTLAEHDLALPVALDPKGRTWRRGGGRELPANLIWTARERELTFGPSDEAAWRARLARLGCPGVGPVR
jgi:thiol-disulfide isomerase/thioredoxin